MRADGLIKNVTTRPFESSTPTGTDLETDDFPAPPTPRDSGASRAIAVLGDAWVLRILRSAFRGVSRFGEFLRALDVSRAVLSDRLERMMADGLLERRPAPHGAHAEYRLTPRGLDLWTVLIGMWRWERDWGTGQALRQVLPVDRPRPRLVHLACGHVITPQYVCGHCAGVVSPFDTEAMAQPEGGATRTTPGLRDLPMRKRYRKARGDDRNQLPTLMRTYGDRWNCALLAAALQGARTFSEFERALGIGPLQLSDRLAELQELGMLRTRAYAGSRQEYRLTRAAIATFPITVALIQWGDRWLCDGVGPLAVRHRPCGHRIDALWVCGECREPLERRALRFA
jgi:DNA-binding HxlR family transcriptional regulator